MTDNESEVEEALNPYSRYPTLTPESEKELTRKWMILCAEVLRLRAELSEQIEARASEHRINDALAKRLEAAKKVVEAARVLVEEFEPDYIESDRVAFELSHSIKSFDAQSSEGK